MVFAKRFRSFLLGLLLLFVIVYIAPFQKAHTSWQVLPTAIELEEYGETEQKELKPFGTTVHSGLSGAVFTKAVVTGRLSEEDTTWLEAIDLPNLQTFVYVVDDLAAPLHVPKNKGNEAMIYLTFIIDHYDDLPDVTMFIHSHRLAWHTNELLNYDALEVIKRLSIERVKREGYMNLRCHWDPGCPERIFPRAKNSVNVEDAAVADAWGTLFPGETIPASLGAPCCAQFAVSRDKILSIPKKRFQSLRNWLLETSLDNWTSGRVFEYLWQKIFNDQTHHCPDMRICYCDGFGICFIDPKEFDYWFELRYKQRQAEKELNAWKKQTELLKSLDRASIKELAFEHPQPGRDIDLQQEIDDLFQELQHRRLEALKLGVDPKIRAAVAGRVWREGDGY